MRHSEFEIGKEFTMSDHIYRCTDKGTRTVAAIRVDSVDVVSTGPTGVVSRVLCREQAEAEHWFHGPPYALAEILLDEYDQEACEPCF